MKTIRDVLLAAADLIEPEGAWTQGVSARDRNGSPVGIKSDNAICWCLLGALHKVCEYTGRNLHGEKSQGKVWDVLYSVAEKESANSGDSRNISQWNDDPSRNQSEVVNLLRKVAAHESADIYLETSI